MLRPWLSSIFISAAVSTAAATGLGGGGSSTVLGQPLDFVVPVWLDPAEAQALDCIDAEVTLGERQLPAPMVRTAVFARSADSARIRVSTTIAIDEPVIGIQISAGCGARVSRRYVLLADPPTRHVELADPAVSIPVGALPLAEALPPAGPMAAGAGTPAVQPVALVPGDAPAARARPRAAPPRDAERRLAQRKSPAKAAAATPDAPARLKLDLVAPAAAAATASASQAVEDALRAVALAASATRAAAAAASANAERLASMERVVEQLRAEARANRELSVQLRQRLGAADQSSLWTLPLLVLALALGTVAAWLAWRLSVVQREREQAWQAAVQPSYDAAASGQASKQQLTAPAPFVTTRMGAAPQTDRSQPRSAPAWPPPAPPANWAPVSTQAPPVTVQLPPRVAAAPAAPGLDPPEAPMQRTDVLPRSAHADDSAARAVSVEELIDLEQQAEFFVVLGQDNSAVELLGEHLRNGGGSSPLPYLKLLEIHQRRGERKAYEAIRARFNHQFNAYAPEWDADHAAGRTLADYSGVLPRLQQVWSRPLDAMAELESLLFRKTRGELFDLPAYREVLFLYALARDLMDRESAETGDVDLLLPMSDGTEFGSTAPTPFLSLDAKTRSDDADPHPTLPLDFDLTAADRPTSIFDPLIEIPPTRH